MKSFKNFSVKVDNKTYIFYNEIAKLLNRPIEDILSDTLYKYAEIVVREADKNNRDSKK